MCFSVEASITAAAALVPVGGFTVFSAWRKDRAFLPLAGVPLMFGVQQACEGGVWAGLTHHPEWVQPWAVAFLVFAIALWPGWVPLAVAALETGTRRWVFGVLSALGFVAGFGLLTPAALRYGEWLTVAVGGHSVVYDFSGVPGADTPVAFTWQVFYLAAVFVPLLICTRRGVKWLGVLVVAAAVAAYLVYRHAFASVWCFFGAVVSAYIAVLLFRLPTPPATPSPQYSTP